MQQMTEVAKLLYRGEVRGVRQLGERRDAVDGCVEDELGPLRGTGISERLSFQTRLFDQLGKFFHQFVRRVCWLKGTHPRRRVQLVMYVVVGKAGAAHEGC